MKFSKLRIGPLIPALFVQAGKYQVNLGQEGTILVHQDVELPVYLLNDLCCTFHCILVDYVKLQSISIKELEECVRYEYGVRDEGSCYCPRRGYGVLEDLETPSSDVDLGAAAGKCLRDHQTTRIHASAPAEATQKTRHVQPSSSTCDEGDLTVELRASGNHCREEVDAQNNFLS